MKGLDGRCQCPAPPKLLLQVLEKDSEGIKEAVTETTKETDQNDNPAIVKSWFCHFHSPCNIEEGPKDTKVLIRKKLVKIEFISLYILNQSNSSV